MDLVSWISMGCAISQGFSCRLLTMEAHVSPCGISGGQSGTGRGFPLSLSFHHYSPYSYITWRMKRLLVATVRRHSVTPLVRTGTKISMYVRTHKILLSFDFITSLNVLTYNHALLNKSVIFRRTITFNLLHIFFMYLFTTEGRSFLSVLSHITHFLNSAFLNENMELIIYSVVEHLHLPFDRKVLMYTALITQLRSLNHAGERTLVVKSLSLV
jgi:hypothetical protein